MVWQSISAQLAKENRKFIYSMLREGARAKDFEVALQWLADCGLIHRVHRVSKPGMPLKAYHDLTAFKLYLVKLLEFAAYTALVEPLLPLRVFFNLTDVDCTRSFPLDFVE